MFLRVYIWQRCSEPMSTGPCLFVGQELGKPLSDPDFRGCFVDLSKALGLRYWQVGHDDFSYVSGSFVANVSGVMEALREAGALRPPPLVSS